MIFPNGSNKCWCDVCGDYTQYSIVDTTGETGENKKTLAYTWRKAVCQKCHREVYIKELVDANLDNMVNALKQNKRLQNEKRKGK